MKERKKGIRRRERFFDSIELPRVTIIIPIIIYELFAFGVSIVSRSQEIIMIDGKVLPVTTLAGVITAFANICSIIMVLMYKRLGYIVSVILILFQVPRLIAGIIALRNLTAIPGLFINLTTILSMTIIYLSQKRLKNERERLETLFDQTATALVNAIDAKDKYTHGHSSRVAEYSRKIAEMSGKSERECDEIYYAALLHDVGKIGIPVSIINKTGKLTPDEYNVVKQHPFLGAQILENISEFPFLSVGAHYHHERFDGRGYPDGLSGKDIPDLARIITVADAYDAMTSIRSYRDPIPQQKVREELVVNAGSQFDPEYARLMLHLVDEDKDYEMREEPSEVSSQKDELIAHEYRSVVKAGIHITARMTSIRMTVSSADEATGIAPFVSLILFDSLDGQYHSNEKAMKDFLYFEYGEINLDGETTVRGARAMQAEISEEGSQAIRSNGEYIIDAVRIKDHALIRILGKNQTAKIIVALPDSSRYLYIGLTGENCHLTNIEQRKATMDSPMDFIPRIAEEISFIKDCPSGDIPNLQVDGDRTEFTEGILLENKLKLSFHSKSLPTARLVWHCPFIMLFSSVEGRVEGVDYHEYTLLKLNGEISGADEFARNSCTLKRGKDFPGWEGWKKANKEGMDFEITIEKNGNEIIARTENVGLSIESRTTLKHDTQNVYVALTGDQVALTSIKVKKR